MKTKILVHESYQVYDAKNSAYTYSQREIKI